jgi:hypothetical protein
MPETNDLADPLFEAVHEDAVGGRFRPTDAARGPWGDFLSGMAICGILAREVERCHGDPVLQPSRLTIDLYRPTPVTTVEIETRVVRDGRRLRTVDADLVADGASCARASCVLLRRGDEPPGSFWSPEDWNVAAPETIAPTADGPDWIRPIDGRMDTLDQRRAWFCRDAQLVRSVENTPFVRVALSSDFASPFALHSDVGLFYINSDITLNIHRLPAGDWIGFEVASAGATDGVAVGNCFLYDSSGRIGSVVMGALAQQHPAQPKR